MEERASSHFKQNDDTSVSLILRVANVGDDVGWQTLEAIYRPLIRHQLQAFPRISGFADDVSQEVWATVHRSIAGFVRQRTGSFRCWLRQITIHKIQECLRQQSRFPCTAQEESEILSRLEQLQQPASEACLLWDEEEKRRVLRFAMDQAKQEFNAKHWAAFQQSKIENHPPEKVCLELEITRDNLNQINKRITDRLRSIASACELSFEGESPVSG